MFDFKNFLDKNNINYGKKGLKHIKLEKNGTVTLYFKSVNFGGLQIKLLLAKLNFIVNKYGSMCHTICIKFESIKPIDKLTYILLECIIYELMRKYKNIWILTKEIIPEIQTSGLSSSLLWAYIRGTITKEQYCKRFFRSLQENHYRRMIRQDDSSEISKLMTDIKIFLKVFDIEDEDRRKIAKIVSELADNACEHSKSDCLIDIDVSNPIYKKRDDPDGVYYSVNICVLNFSDIFLGDTLREKIMKKKYKDSNRYEDVANAYETHKSFFNFKYTEEHFFMLTAFQNKISGRENETETGGVGLNEMICEVEKRADTHNCYVLSKNKVICFLPEYLVNNLEGWVGFNKEHDFLNSRPSTNSIYDSDTFLTGTGYNLSLIYRRK